MARYTVNVHYDIVATVEVVASSEQEAIELANKEAGNVPIHKMDCVGSQCCITNIE